MPGKSRHGKGKHHYHGKKSRARHHVPMVSQAVAGTPQPAATVSAPPPSRAPTAATTPRAIQHPYITAELRNIGILSGVILVILIVLARILS